MATRRCAKQFVPKTQRREWPALLRKRRRTPIKKADPDRCGSAKGDSLFPVSMGLGEWGSAALIDRPAFGEERCYSFAKIGAAGAGTKGVVLGGELIRQR